MADSAGACGDGYLVLWWTDHMLLFSLPTPTGVGWKAKSRGPRNELPQAASKISNGTPRLGCARISHLRPRLPDVCFPSG